MIIRFGPAGLGGVKEAIGNLEEFHRLGIRACEISFTYGPYIKKEDAPAIKESAERLGIQLSIHAPYWINLNSDDAKKLDMSKRRILASCEVGEWLGVKYVVFHAGFYGKGSREEAYENIRDVIKEIMAEMKAREYKVKIAVETMGKINVFGSDEEIKRLVRDTGCSFCLDFAHLIARSNGKMTYKEMVDSFREFDSWHCHFSGIVYGDKGEKNHIPTSSVELKKLLSSLPADKDITIINESPVPVEDSVECLRFFEGLGK
jgi:deoxyribonuclease-4